MKTEMIQAKDLKEGMTVKISVKITEMHQTYKGVQVGFFLDCWACNAYFEAAELVEVEAEQAAG